MKNIAILIFLTIISISCSSVRTETSPRICYGLIGEALEDCLLGMRK